MKLVKIEEGFQKGEVLYHALVNKTDEEKEALRRLANEREQRRLENRRVQEENVRRKEMEKEKALKDKKEAFAAKSRKLTPTEEALRDIDGDMEGNGQDPAYDDDQDEIDQNDFSGAEDNEELDEVEIGEDFEDFDEYTETPPAKANPLASKKASSKSFKKVKG